jgi:hypothetical protein
MKMELNVWNLDIIMREVLLTKDECKAANLSSETTLADMDKTPDWVRWSYGYKTIYAFSETRLLKQEENIKLLLSDLPQKFFLSDDGGWSLWNAVQRKDGMVWGSHVAADALFCLGQALGLCKYLTPRHMSRMMPKEMPYFVISLDGFKNPETHQ